MGNKWKLLVGLAVLTAATLCLKDNSAMAGTIVNTAWDAYGNSVTAGSSGTTVRNGQLMERYHSGDTGGIPSYPLYSWRVVTTGDANGWNAAGGNNITITAIDGVSGSGNGMSASNNTVTITSGSVGDATGATLTMHTNNDRGNHLNINGTGTPAEGHISANSTVNVGYGDITMTSGTVHGTINAETATTTASADASTYFRQSGGTMSATGSVNIAGGGSTFRIDSNAIFNGVANLNGTGGHTVIVDIGNTNPGYNVTGEIDLTGTTGGTNNVHLANGTILGMIRGASATGETNFYIGNVTTAPAYPGDLTGVTPPVNDTTKANLKVKQIYGGTGVSHYQVTSGQAYNIWAGVSGEEGGANTPNYNLADQIQVGSTAVFLNGTVLADNSNLSTAGSYQVYSLLGVEKVAIGGSEARDRALVTIGAIDPSFSTNADANTYAPVNLQTNTGYNEYYNGRQAQITADTVNVNAGSKLIIHESALRYGQTIASLESAAGGDFTNDHDRNVINSLNISGTVTLDRTTIHGSTNYDATVAGSGATVTVNNGGVLQGFGEFLAGDPNHDPIRPNIIGTLTVERGGMLRPFDSQLFTFQGNVSSPFVDMPASGETQEDYFARRDAWLADPTNAAFQESIKKLKGVITRVDGESVWKAGSRYSTRLWAEKDGNRTLDAVSDGGDFQLDGVTRVDEGDTATVQRYYSDGLVATTFNFDDIIATNSPLQSDWTNWRAIQQNKVQYFPTFGRANELRSKLDFELYRGDGTDRQTYYFQVAYSESGDPIAALCDPNGTPSATDDYYKDANHLFNRDIVFSDMLGQWDFLKQDDNSGVILRFRLLAPHPTLGGIASIMPERNAREAAKKIDEIRYPFTTAHNSEIGGFIGYDPSSSPNYDNPAGNNWTGYNEEGYSGDMNDFYSQNPQFANYDPDRITDFENFLRGIQMQIISGNELLKAIRLVHPEPYASMTTVNIGVMDQFIANRERNGVSALYMVEKDCLEESASEKMYSPAYQEDVAPLFVSDPIRFWASSFGATGNYDRSGDEYGFDDRVYGSTLGVIKEFGDLYLGATVGYARGKNKWKELRAEADSNNYLSELLVGFRFGNAFLEAYGNYGYMDHKMKRRIEVGSPDDPIIGDPGHSEGYENGIYRANHSADYYDHVFGGGLRLGYQKTLGENWLFLPTIGLNYLESRNGSFTEDGRYDAWGRLVFDKGGAIKKRVLRLPVNLRVNRVIPLPNRFLLTPELRAGYTLIMGQRHGTATAKFIGNPLDNRYFKAYGADPGRHQMNLGATLELSRRGRFYVAGNYDFLLTGKSRLHNFSLQAGLNF